MRDAHDAKFTQRVVIACSILFFCTSVATASNFTPVKSAPPKSALRQRLADEPKCWCTVSSRPQSALSPHYANRPVVSASGRAINFLNRTRASEFRPTPSTSEGKPWPAERSSDAISMLLWRAQQREPPLMPRLRARFAVPLQSQWQVRHYFGDWSESSDPDTIYHQLPAHIVAATARTQPTTPAIFHLQVRAHTARRDDTQPNQPTSLQDRSRG
jgi:hypothetical protein